MWSNDYTGEMNQLFSLQSEIAKEIASELKAELTPEEIKKIEKNLLKILKLIIITFRGTTIIGKLSGFGRQ